MGLFRVSFRLQPEAFIYCVFYSLPVSVRLYNHILVLVRKLNTYSRLADILLKTESVFMAIIIASYLQIFDF